MLQCRTDQHNEFTSALDRTWVCLSRDGDRVKHDPYQKPASGCAVLDSSLHIHSPSSLAEIHTTIDQVARSRNDFESVRKSAFASEFRAQDKRNSL